MKAVVEDLLNLPTDNSPEVFLIVALKRSCVFLVPDIYL